MKSLTPFTLKLRAFATNTVPFACHALCAFVPLAWLQPPHWLAYLPLVILIGNLPDVDTAASHIGRLIPPLSRWLESHYGHRTLTHSLLANVVIYLITFGLAWLFTRNSILATRYAQWCAVFYGSHLVLDMILGGRIGIQMLYPLKWRFWLLNVKSHTEGEAICALLLVAAALSPFLIDPRSVDLNRFLHEQAASPSFAKEDYRNWENQYHVWLDIEGTWQTNHNPIVGRYEVLELMGDTFTLRDSNTALIFTAGVSSIRDEVYLLKAIAHQGDLRRNSIIVPTLSPLSTDVPDGWPQYTSLVTLRITNILSPAAQIKIRPGQPIHIGDLVATLSPPLQGEGPGERSAQPTNLPTFKLDLAAADLLIAQAVYSKSLELPPNPRLDLTGAQARIEAAQSELNYRIQNLYVLTTALAYAQSTNDWREIPYLVGEQDGPKGKRTDVLIREAIAREQIQLNNAKAQLQAAKSSYTNTATSANANTPHLSRAEIALAKAHLEKAKLQATLAAIPPTPTQTPYPDKIYSTVSGIVIAIQVTQQDQTTTVEIIIDTATDQDRAALNAYRNTRRSANQKYISSGANLDNATNYPPSLPTPTLTPSAIRSPDATASPTPTLSRAESAYPLSSVDAITATVTHITDGDTFIAALNGITQTIRIIGIDTPESKKPNTPIQCYAKEAAAYLALLIPPNTVVSLKLGRAPRDKYNRLLAYVWKDSQPIADLLLINGYARTMAIKPNTDQATHYAVLMQQAQQNKVGLWSAC